MNKLIKKSIALLTSLALCTSTAFATIAGAAAAASIDFTIDQKTLTLEEAKAATTVPIKVGVKNNEEGITNYNIKFDYDSRLTVDSIDKTNVSNAQSNTYGPGKGMFVLANHAVANQNVMEGDITFFTVNFVLPDDVAAGDLYDINWTVEYTSFNLGNGNDSSVTTSSFNGIDGFIKIEDETSDEKIDFVIEKVQLTLEEAKALATVPVKVYVENNAIGFTDYNLKFDSDTRLGVDSIEKVNASIAGDYEYTEGGRFVLFNHAVANQNAMEGDLTLLNVNFTLPDDVAAGDIYPIDWSNDHNGFLLHNGNDATVTKNTFNGINGYIEIIDKPIEAEEINFLIEKVTLTLEEAKALASVPVKVYVENNEAGFTDYNLKFDCDTRLGVDSIDKVNASIAGDYEYTEGGRFILFNHAVANQNVMQGDLTLLTVNFTLPDDVAAGDIYPIDWSNNHNGFLLHNGNNDAVTKDSFIGVNGYIEIVDDVVTTTTPPVETTTPPVETTTPPVETTTPPVETTTPPVETTTPPPVETSYVVSIGEFNEQLGYFHADENEHPLSEELAKFNIIATISSVNKATGEAIGEPVQVDITKYCDVVAADGAKNPTPWAAYWAQFNTEAKFDYSLDVVFDVANVTDMPLIAAQLTELGVTTANVGTVTAIIGQRGDANLDHFVDTADAALICFYERDNVAAHFAADMNGTEYVDPTLNAERDVLAKFLANVNEEEILDTADAALVCFYERDYVALEFEKTLAGETVDKSQAVFLWNGIKEFTGYEDVNEPHNSLYPGV